MYEVFEKRLGRILDEWRDGSSGDVRTEDVGPLLEDLAAEANKILNEVL